MSAFKKNSARQQVIVAYADVTFDQLVSGTFKPLIELPAGAVVLSGALNVRTAFNSGTSDVATVGDATTGNRYKASATVAAAGYGALVPTGLQATAPTTVGVTWTAVGTAATAGALRLIVEYFVAGRAQFAQGLDN